MPLALFIEETSSAIGATAIPVGITTTGMGVSAIAIAEAALAIVVAPIPKVPAGFVGRPAAFPMAAPDLAMPVAGDSMETSRFPSAGFDFLKVAAAIPMAGTGVLIAVAAFAMANAGLVPDSSAVGIYLHVFVVRSQNPPERKHARPKGQHGWPVPPH